MNNKLLAVALAAAFAAPAFAQTSNVTLYGRINTSFENDTATGSRSSAVMRNNSSRLGVRGTEDLGGGLKAVFGIETALASDSGAGGLGGDLRNSYVGLSGGFGTAVAGRLDISTAAAIGGAPSYAAYLAVFNDINHDTGSTALNQTNGLDIANQNATYNTRPVFGNRTRASNAVGYQLPTFVQGLDLGLRYAMLSTNDATLAPNAVAAANGDRENNIRELEAAAIYKLNALSLTGAYTDRSTKVTAPAQDNIDGRWQLGAAYDFGIVKLGGLYARTKYQDVTAGNRNNSNEYGLSLAAPFGAHKVIFNVASRQLQGRETAALTVNPGQVAPALGRDRAIQLGYNYDFSKRTMGYAFYQVRDNNTSSNVNGAGNTAALTEKVKTLGVGLRHNF